MSHLAAKDIYGELEGKIDGLWMRTPARKSFYDVLRRLYTETEARMVVAMPFGFAGLPRIAKLAGMAEAEALRSRFLAAMRTGIKLQGKGWLLDM